MSEEATATAQARAWSPAIKSLGDQLVELKIREAQELKDYLKEVHGIEPAAGGAVMMAAAPSEEAVEAAPQKTDFDVVITTVGDQKIPIIKVVRAATGLSLKEAKDLVENPPKTVKEKLPKADAEKLKEELEAAGATVELK